MLSQLLRRAHEKGLKTENFGIIISQMTVCDLGDCIYFSYLKESTKYIIYIKPLHTTVYVKIQNVPHPAFSASDPSHSPAFAANCRRSSPAWHASSPDHSTENRRQEELAVTSANQKN